MKNVSMIYVQLFVLVSTVCFAGVGIPFGPCQMWQPDHTTSFMMISNGDGLRNAYMTMEGYVFVRNQSTGYYEYAMLDSDGEYTPCGKIVGIDPPVQGSYMLKRSVARLAVIDSLERGLAKKLVFIPSYRTKTVDIATYEAKMVAKVVRLFHEKLSISFKENSIGIITPFRSQISAIRKQLTEPWAEMITIDTVERFQGSERKIIIVSLAIDNLTKAKFIQSISKSENIDRKLNVIISRARECLVLVGNKYCLKKLYSYDSYLKTLSELIV